MQEQRVAVAAVGGREDDGCAVADEAEVGDEAVVEDRVQVGPVDGGPVALAAQRAAGGGG